VIPSVRFKKFTEISHKRTASTPPHSSHEEKADHLFYSPSPMSPNQEPENKVSVQAAGQTEHE